MREVRPIQTKSQSAHEDDLVADSTRKYQVFLSSTFEDLKDVRWDIFKILLEARLIVEGMEFFGASDQRNWEVITQRIDESDIYVLIIEKNYGSIKRDVADSISWTEAEYRYALSQNKRILSFLWSEFSGIGHEAAEKIAHFNQLRSFRKELEANGRGVKYWRERNELPGLISTACLKECNRPGMIGWLRAVETRSVEDLKEILDLRSQVAALREELSAVIESEPRAVGEIYGELLNATVDVPLKAEGIWSVNASTVLLSVLSSCAKERDIGHIADDLVQFLSERSKHETGHSKSIDFFAVQDYVKDLVVKLANIGLVKARFWSETPKFTLSINGEDLLAHLFHQSLTDK